jgi:hypothetical protein
MAKTPKLLPPRVLVASTTEALPGARALKDLLSPEIHAEIWDEGLFEPGEFTLESLQSHAHEFDGALVIATADDRVVSRRKASKAPRDNILFEFGLFVAIFGHRRSLLLVESAKAIKLPTDIAGLTCLRFATTTPHEVGLEDAARNLKRIAGRWQETPVDADQVKRLNELLRLVLSDIQERSGIGSGLGLHVFLPSRRMAPPSLVRVARQRSSAKSPKSRTFAFGEGVVGTCWRREEHEFLDLANGLACTASKAEWNALSDDKRYGMDWKLLKSSRERYSAVGAVPIASFNAQPGFMGCVAYNLSAGVDASALRGPAVVRRLDECAEMMAIVLAR